MDLARAPRRTARKKGSGYENDSCGLKAEKGLLMNYNGIIETFYKYNSSLRLKTNRPIT
jgi:hypothetical protein